MPQWNYNSDGDRIKTNRNNLSQESYLRDIYNFNRISMFPSNAIPSFNTTVLSNDWEAVEMRNAQDDFAGFQFARPTNWRKGNLKVQLYWTDDTSSSLGGANDTVVTGVRILGYLDEGVGTTELMALTENTQVIPTQTTALDTWPVQTYETTSAVEMGDYPIFHVRAQRLASTDPADDYLSSVYLLGGTVEYQPSQRQ